MERNDADATRLTGTPAAAGSSRAARVPDLGATRASTPDDLGATRAAVPGIDAADDPNATRLAAPGAPADATVAAASPTSRMGAVPTTQLPRGAATSVLPGSASAPGAVADGIDALDDPYVSPVNLADLTTARRPVELQSPVKSTKKKGMPVWGVLIIVVLVLGGLAGAAWYTYDRELWGGRTVPLVVGLDEATATSKLEAAGFSVEVSQAPADDGIGTVTACSPEPGKRADSKQATLTVAVARTIPQVTGSSLEAAQKALLDMGATNIRIQSVNSDAQSGTVVEVSPAEGSEFKSGDEVVLSVATPYVVPSVMGLTADAAKAAVEKAGLSANVTYVKSDAARNTVVECEPEAGTQASEGDVVELQVSTPYPEEVTDLTAYFDATSKEVATYLNDEKYTLVYGSTLFNGDAHAVYRGADGDMITFSPNPETGSYAGGKTDDVLGSGAPISGVRYVYASGAAPAGGTSETVSGVRAVMEACGLSGLKETATEQDLAGLGVLAQSQGGGTAGSSQTQADTQAQTDGRHFICGYGEMDQYSWAVVIGGPKDVTNVVVLVCPRSHFNGGVDLSAYDNSPAKYIGYVSVYDGQVSTQKGDDNAQ